MAHDLGMGWQSVQDLPAHQREFLLDEIDLLDDVVQTPWVEKEEERRNRAYDHLYTKFKKAADESGQPVSADNAEWLVRCHPSMPSPFFGRASRATFTLVKHPPDEIQQHFDGAFGELVQKTFTVLALRSIEWFEKIEARAPTSPRCFDALHDAAMLASSPDRVIFRSVPAEERLRQMEVRRRYKAHHPPIPPKGSRQVQEYRPRPLFPRHREGFDGVWSVQTQERGDGRGDVRVRRGGRGLAASPQVPSERCSIRSRSAAPRACEELLGTC